MITVVNGKLPWCASMPLGMLLHTFLSDGQHTYSISAYAGYITIFFYLSKIKLKGKNKIINLVYLGIIWSTGQNWYPWTQFMNSKMSFFQLHSTPLTPLWLVVVTLKYQFMSTSTRTCDTWNSHDLIFPQTRKNREGRLKSCKWLSLMLKINVDIFYVRKYELSYNLT